MRKRILDGAIALALLATATGVAAQPAGPATAAAAVGTRLADGSGYVTITPTGEGPEHLLMAFEQKGMVGIALWRSDDGGDHWQFVANAADQVHKDPSWQLRWQPHLMRMQRASGDLAAGTLILSANATRSGPKGKVLEENLQVYASTDGGATWQYRGTVVTGVAGHGGVWETNVHILPGGQMVAYYSTEEHKAEGYNQALAHKVSTDGGRTWGQEVFDVAIPGGVLRPGMAVVTRMGDGRFAMTYENIAGANNGQVHIKFSPDGLHWGDPHQQGTPIATASGAWPAACPVVRWFATGGPQGTLVVSAERAGGGGDPGGRSLYWNNAGGRGPWWEVPAPVQKQTGNIHAGWTQALIRRADGQFLHATTSSSPSEPNNEWANEVLYRSAPLDFDRYEAEDAAMRGAVATADATASNGRKATLQGAGADLHFAVAGHGGARTLQLRYAAQGQADAPKVVINGVPQPAGTVHGEGGGWAIEELQVNLTPGADQIDVQGGAQPIAVDYLAFGHDDAARIRKTLPDTSP